MSNKLKGFLALLGCGVIFGSFGIYIRLLSVDLDVYQQILFRNAVAFFLAFVLMIIFRAKPSLNGVPKKFLFLYAFSFTLEVVLFNFSVLTTKILVSLFSLYVGAIGGSLLLGIIFFKEKMTRMKAVSLLLVFVGLLFLAYPSLTLKTLNIGFLYGFLAGLLDGIANSFRKYLSGKIDRLMLVAIQMIGGIVVATLLMIYFKSSFALNISSESLLIGLLFGSLLIAVSYLSLVGFQNFDLNLGTIIISSELFFGPLFASIIFNEYPNTLEIIGGVCILLAVVIPNVQLEKKILEKFQIIKK